MQYVDARAHDWLDAWSARHLLPDHLTKGSLVTHILGKAHARLDYVVKSWLHCRRQKVWVARQ